MFSTDGLRKREPSLAARLSWWYGISSFFLVMLITGFLYWALLRNFDQQNERYLAEKIAILRTLLRDSGARRATVKWEVEEELAAHPSIRVLSRVLSWDGGKLFETAGMSGELPPQTIRTRKSNEVRSPTGRVYHVMTADVSGPSGGQAYHLQTAIDLSYQKDLLDHYRNQLWFALACGFILSLIIGHRIAHGGIEPLKQMAQAVERIRSNTLDERIRLQDAPAELSALSGTLNQTLDRLQEAFNRLSQFSSDIAHELRTPVNNIRGELEVALTRTRSGGEYREVIGSALEECQRLGRIIDSLLFLARAEHPEAGVHRERLDLRSEFDKLVEFYGIAAHDRGITLDARIPEYLSANIDRNLFQRAIGNLVENAFRYTPNGGRVTLEAKKRGERLALIVSDTGSGIAAAHVPHIFDRFYRADAARTAEAGGTGLGLAIVKSIARLHGGEVEIATEEGAGTAVTLLLEMTET